MEKIYRHLFVEFYLGKKSNEDNLLKENTQRLFESFGVIPLMEKYVESFKNALLNGKTIITADEFNFSGKFFDTADIRMVRGQNKNNSGYSNNNSGFYKDKDGELHYIIRMSISFASLNDALTSFSHELIHAYDDYCRKTKQKNEYEITGKVTTPAIIDYSRKTGQNKATMLTLMQTDSIEKTIGTLMYYLNNVERNSYIGQTYQELVNNAHRISDSSSAMTELRRTESWSVYQWVKRNVSELIKLKKSDDEEKKNEILGTFNFITNLDINDFGKFVILIYKKYLAWEKHYLNQTSKMVYQIFQKYGTPFGKPNTSI